MSSSVNEIYNGSAELGKFTSLMYLIGAIIVGVILVICAIMNFTAAPYQTTNATVTAIGTIGNTTNNTNTGIGQQANISVSYNVANKNYNSSLPTNGKTYTLGQTITIQYSPSNPTQILNVGSSSNNTTMGIISLVIPVILVGATYFNYYVTSHNKMYASAEGVRTFMNNI